MPTIGQHNERDRAVSITLTHVLTIGITTVLIAMLLTASGTMLESETERSADASLETIGERIANEIGNVDQIANGTDDSVTLTTEHPRTVASSRYTIELRTDCDEPLLDEVDCVTLTAEDTDAVAHVPIKTDETISETSATGGTIEIVYESDEISIRSRSR
ncbi:DUF7266 family protein [Natrinema sp. LN54]|uniref:DUF7266 family protein n=1 Tax=Natrinema sp. LN54 TaxID=3458705 RepID=UPI004036A84D